MDTSVYRKGTDLRRDVLCTSCMERSVVLVYEDLQTGGLQEFSLSDTTWYDTCLLYTSMEHYGVKGMVRASFAFYNTEREADALVAGVERAVRMLR